MRFEVSTVVKMTTLFLCVVIKCEFVGRYKIWRKIHHQPHFSLEDGGSMFL
jgi:hypothetical protein